MEYRIKELNGVFTIQVKGYKRNFFFWWIKKWSWYTCNRSGGVYNFEYSFMGVPMLYPFTSLQEAKEQIKEFKSKATYHTEPF